MARLKVYALGGGLGHLQRSLGLARAASRRGHTTTILTNSPVASEIEPHWQRLSPKDVSTRIEALRGAPEDILRQGVTRAGASDHDVLIVDTLPRGIGGELDDLLRQSCQPRVLVHRDLKPSYAGQPDVLDAARRYDLILSPGERGPLTESLPTVETEPWLLLDAHELADRTTARTALGIRADEPNPVVVICESTDRHEHRGLAALADRWQEELRERAFFLTTRVRDRWPLLRWHLGIDLLVSAGGYNTVHETRATNTPLRALARDRLYDRQQHRLREGEVLGTDLRLTHRGAETPSYCNGVHAALEAIEAVL